MGAIGGYSGTQSNATFARDNDSGLSVLTCSKVRSYTLCMPIRNVHPVCMHPVWWSLSWRMP